MGTKAITVALGMTGVPATASVWGLVRRSRRPHGDGRAGRGSSGRAE
ncbi:hypothetical protein SCB71_04330 [Herbiconiux sp. KACC 21604]|nr:hypothetical protein [Herbiconiux sp. SALV-R1]WPO87476.1 hypothetical protein SCB71_04330 [Herbiconiux sp. KACC 21604]